MRPIYRYIYIYIYIYIKCIGLYEEHWRNPIHSFFQKESTVTSNVMWKREITIRPKYFRNTFHVLPFDIDCNHKDCQRRVWCSRVRVFNRFGCIRLISVVRHRRPLSPRPDAWIHVWHSAGSSPTSAADRASSNSGMLHQPPLWVTLTSHKVRSRFVPRFVTIFSVRYATG